MGTKRGEAIGNNRNENFGPDQRCDTKGQRKQRQK